MADTIKIVLTIDDSQMSVASQRVGSNLKQLQTAIQQTADSTKRIDEHFTGLTHKFGELIQTAGLLRFALYDIRDVFGATVGKVIESSAQIEKLTVLMAGLSKQTTQVGKDMEAIANRNFVINLSKTAPFEVKALSDAFVKFKSAGLDPTNGSLKALVDSVAKFGGNSETLDRASVAIQQMSGKGVISMEELRQQLGEAVPTAMQNMADGAGMSMAEFVKHVSKGEVESKDALKRMFTVMSFENQGAAEALNKTWTGQFEKLKTNLTLFTNEIGTSGGGFEALKKGLGDLNAYFDSSKGRQFAINLGQAFASIVDDVTSLTSAISKYGEEIKELGQALVIIWGGSVVNKALQGVKASIGDNLKALKDAYVQEVGYQNTKLANIKRGIELEAEATAEKLLREKENAIAENEVLAAKYAQAMEMKLQYEAMYEQADKVATTKRLANGTFASKAMQAQQQALSLGYAQVAAEAEAEAARFAAAQVRMAEASTAATVAIRENLFATEKAIAGVETVATKSSVAMGLLGKAFNLMGGWIGIITTALTIGITAWQLWGDAAKKANDEALDAINATKAGFADLNTASKIQTGLNNDNKELNETVDKLNKLRQLGITGDKGGAFVDGTYIDIGKVKAKYDQLISAIQEKQAMVRIAAREGRDNSIAEWSKTGIKTIDDSLADKISAIKTFTDERLIELRKLPDSDKTKGKQINEAIADGIKKQTDIELATIDLNLKLTSDRIKANTDAKGKVINENVNKYYQSYLDALSKKRDEVARRRADGEEIKTPFQLGKGKDATRPLRTPEENVSAQLDKLLAKLKGQEAELGVGVKKISTHFLELQASIDAGKLDYKLGKSIVRPKIDSPQVAEQLNKAKQADALEEEIAKLKESYSVVDSVVSALDNQNIKTSEALQNSIDNLNYGTKANTKSMTTIDVFFAEKIKAVNVKLKELSELPDSDAVQKAKDALNKLKDTLEVDGKKNLQDTNKIALNENALKELEDTKKINNSLIKNNSDRLEAQYRDEVSQLEELFQARVANANLSSDELEKIQKIHNEHMNALNKRHLEEMKSPLQKLSDSWQDTTKQMQDASTGWANKTVDAFVQLAKTGKMNFKDLIDGILTDLLRIQMQKQIGGAIQGVFDSVIGVLGGAGKSQDTYGSGTSSKGIEVQNLATKATESLAKAAVQASAGASDLTDSLGQSATETVLQAGKTATLSSSMNFLATSATNAANALNQLSGSSVTSGGSGGGLFGDIFGGISDFFGFGDSGAGTFTDGGVPMGGLTAANLLPSLFANGGIMTSMGPMELRQYANGGIANKPQIALFGEGRMNEAYVPLPDGKTIPVTMSGGGGVTVNVINNAEGTEVKQNKTQNPDGSTSIDVIIQQVENKLSQNLSKGRGNLATVMEKTYGLNRAVGAY